MVTRRVKDSILKPLEYGNQKLAIRSNADIVCFTGNTGGGKSYALYYSPIQYLAQNDNAKIVCFMRNISDFWGAGKVNDTLKKMYPLIDRSMKKQPHDPIGEVLRTPTDMGMRLYNGSEIKFQQLDNESPVVIDKIAKGLQAKKLIFDECNKFQWRTITSFMPRLRSDSQGKAQIYLAQNPERNCFMRKLCGKGEHGGGWINDDGTIDKSMDGVVMYFNMQEGDLERTYFGRTKLEVYEKCKEHIDSLIAISPDMSYEDFILSMVFFTFDVGDNKQMLEKNRRYRGLAANSATALSAHGGNWNYSIEDEVDDVEEVANVQISPQDIEAMFEYEQMPQNATLQRRFVTVDMATTGFDNMVMMYWEQYSNYGFVCKDVAYSVHNSPFEGVRLIVNFRDKHEITDKEMILDTQGFQFLKDCFPKCRSFTGAGQTSMRGRKHYVAMKDEAGHLAMEMIKARLIHFDHTLAEKRYTHKNMKRVGSTSLMRHLKFESVIFQFTSTPSGKLQMLGKEQQKKMIRGMSPDLTDNIIMLCGANCYDCHRILSEDSGYMRKKASISDMLKMVSQEEDIRPKAKIRHNERILNVLSTI